MMPSVPRTISGTVRYRFGSFDVDSMSETLLKNGARVKIQKLPFQMLLSLLENAGSVVSRDELKQRLWRDKSHVEFDNGLHVAATKLRQALEEDSATPRFLKTVAREGYQFIAAVVVTAESSPVEELPVTALVLPQLEAVVGPHYSVARVVLGLSVVALLAGVMVFSILHIRRSFQYRQQTIYLGTFANATGKAEMDDLFTVLFRESLRESPFLRFVDTPRDSQFAGSQDKAGASADIAGQLDRCRLAGGQVLLAGLVVNRPPGYNVTTGLWDCASRGQLIAQDSYARTMVDTVQALEDATNKLRSSMGEPAEMLNRFNIANRQATTSSLAALRAFSMGDERRDRGQSNDAIIYYKMAIDLDPRFALAYARLGAIYSNRADFDSRRNYYSTAFRLRDLTTERERLYIMAHYYSEVTGDIVQAIATYKLWASLYPYDPVPENNLANQYYLLGSGSEAVDAARAALKLDPGNKVVYATLASALLEAGDSAEMKRICLGPMGQSNDTTVFHKACFLFAFEQGDEQRMKVEIDSARAAIGHESMLNDESWIAMAEGNVQKAHRLFLAAAQQNLDRGLIEEAALIHTDAALTEADIGLSSRARKDAADALKLDSSSALVQASAALALARVGDTSNAKQLIDGAAKESPTDTIVNAALLPSAHAAIQLAEEDPSSAIQSLEGVKSFDFVPEMSLAPAYYRGIAYARENRLPEANAQFQQVIGHRSIFPASLYIPLAELELAHSLQLSGNNAGASQLFQQLQTLWQHADPEFSPLRRLRSYMRSMHEQELMVVETIQTC